MLYGLQMLFLTASFFIDITGINLIIMQISTENFKFLKNKKYTVKFILIK